MKFFSKRLSLEPSPLATFEAAKGLALHNVSVSVPHHDQHKVILSEITHRFTASRTAILGLNGSGKSTLLKLFNGLCDTTAGEVSVHGVDVAQNINAIRKHVGMLFSDPQAQLILPTPIEDVELSLRATIKDAAARHNKAQELLDARGIGHLAHSSVYELSGGERQLVALTAVLAVNPQVLLLDEPTTLLDLQNKLRLSSLLDELPQQIMVSTHDLELAQRCDDAVIVHQGTILQSGPSSEMIQQYRQWCAEGFPQNAKVHPAGTE